jgi:hypothetical protein
LTYVNYGLRARVAQGITLLPAFSLGETGMSTGTGDFAAYRPPVLQDDSFARFAFDPESALPPWALRFAANLDQRTGNRVHPSFRSQVDLYQLTRRSVREYNRIFTDDILKIDNRSTTEVDGISNRDLETMFGRDETGRRAALSLRLFHFGCPAVFMNQGGYDLHSREDQQLPPQIEELSRLLSGFRAALQRMRHPEGGTYWDKTLVVVGSEFGRTTSGSRFNSAGGSDHSSDLATRWMSMPMMGGVINGAGKGGRRIGGTRRDDLRAEGPVFAYRSMMKLLLDLLGCDHSIVFTSNPPIQELFL